MKKKKYNLILEDSKIDEQNYDLLRQLHDNNKELWKVEGYANNYLPHLMRQITYLIYPLLLTFRIGKIEKIIAMQQFFGIALAFYCRLLHLKSNIEITIVSFIYKEKKGIIGKLYYRFVKYAIESKYIKHIVVHSTHEITYYSKLFCREFEYCSLGIKDSSDAYIIKNNMPNKEENGYFLACGRSNRDYKFLIEVFSDIPYELRIICDEIDMTTHDNISIYKDVFGKEYYEMLSKCYAVIVPLKDTNISSGQLSLIEATMFGKPVIVTNSEGIKDYFLTGMNIITNTEQELKTAVENLLQKNEYDAVCRKMRDGFVEQFQIEDMNKKLINIVYSI